MLGVMLVVFENNNKSLVISINKEDSIIQNSDFSKPVDNELVFKYLEKLYRITNDWQKEYINTRIIDGNSWKLSITFDSGNKREYYGRASYPTNFEAFERLNQELIDEVSHG